MPRLRLAAVGAVMACRAGVLKIDELRNSDDEPRQFTNHSFPRLQADHVHVSALSKRLIDGLTSRVEHIVRNGDANGYPGCVNLSFAYVEVSVVLASMCSTSY